MGRVFVVAFAVAVVSALVVAMEVDPKDLHRAQTKVPRAPYKGNTPHAMGQALNGHMRRMFPNTKPCEQWTSEELQTYQSQLYEFRRPEFDSIYQNSTDNRRLLQESLKAYQSHWSKVN